MATAKFNILGEFKDEGLERDYGRWTMTRNRPHAYFGMALVSAVWLVFIPTDYRLYGLSTTFYLLLALRGWQIFLAAAIAVLISRNDNPKLYNYAMCIFWASTLAAILMVNTTRPTDYVIYFFVDIIALVFSYMLIPNGLIYQIAPAFIFTAFSLNYFLYYKHIQDPNVMQLVMTAYIMVNLIGIIISRRHNGERRKRYLILTDLQRTNNDLAKALAEIKTLRGIVPICAKCKKIRDDKGYWNQLEKYMETHLDAEFSHGICPQCMQELYPELADEVSERQNVKPEP